MAVAKRTKKGPNFERQMRELDPKSELSHQVRVQAKGLWPETGTARRQIGFRDTSQCAKTQNRGNEAKKSLKTKDDVLYKVRKRSQLWVLNARIESKS